MSSEIDRGINPDRCPSCGGAVGADADWCNQCYARLRAEPTPTTAVVTAPEPSLPIVAEPQATTVPAQPTESPLPGVVQADPLGDVSAVPVAEAPAPVAAPAAWPCGRCKTAVPFDVDICPNCGARFLEPELPGADASLLDKLPRGERKAGTALFIMVIGCLVLTAVFIGLMALFGAIF